MADSPTFTVIVPAYNAEATVGATLESLLAQTYPPTEVLVVDDGSRDRTSEIVSSFPAPVRLIRQPNAGTAAARNRALQEASCEVIAFLDADDLYEPDRLEQIAAKFAAEPDLEAVATDAALESDSSRKLVSSWWPPAARRDRIDATAPIIFCTLTIRRELAEQLGGFDSRYRILEDLDYWYRIGCRRRRVGYIDVPSYRYRIHSASKTGSRPSRSQHREFFEINIRYALSPGTPLHLRARLLVRGSRHGRAGLLAWLRRR